MRKSLTPGFTLVELLIVMGVLAVLVVTILVSLNPSEAQKKSRDTKRMKDLATLEAIVLQWTQDGNAPIDPTSCPTRWFWSARNFTVCISDSAGSVQSQPCATNWLGVNLCNYTKTVPVDPLNAQYCSQVYGTLQSPQIRTDIVCHYALSMKGSDYWIAVYQESKSNIGNIINDGGLSEYVVEKSSDMSLW